MLTQAQEFADPDDHARDLARRVEQDLADVADLLVVIVVDVYAHKLGSSPPGGCCYGRRGGCRLRAFSRRDRSGCRSRLR